MSSPCGEEERPKSTRFGPGATNGISFACECQECEACHAPAPSERWRINTDLDTGYGYRTKMGPQNHDVSLAESQHHIINPTNPRSTLDDGVEDRLHVRRRAADDAEHLGRCRLMLQGLAQFSVALAEFLEQAHVLNGDHRLVGEGFEKRDLLIGKWSNLLSTNYNYPDRNSLP